MFYLVPGHILKCLESVPSKHLVGPDDGVPQCLRCVHEGVPCFWEGDVIRARMEKAPLEQEHYKGYILSDGDCLIEEGESDEEAIERIHHILLLLHQHACSCERKRVRVRRVTVIKIGIYE